ncbi:hypothetical protein [Enterobacter ludwigii]|uniref:hypothetical protein n=1 Tax=Enterobacter ludwigii TaxID=299767 RepID=UPI00397611E4
MNRLKLILSISVFLGSAVFYSTFAATSVTDVTLNNSSRDNIVFMDRDLFGSKLAYSIMTSAYHSQNAGDECDANPEYYCNGLMVSAFEYDDMYWEQTAPPYGKLSLTYFRNDTSQNSYVPIYYLNGAGFVLWPQAALFKFNVKQNSVFGQDFRCAYPQDGNTNGKANNGCGIKPCAPQDWGGNNCTSYALGVSPADDSKTISKLMAQQIEDNKTFGLWNEYILKPWEEYAPEKIPLMSFFYISDSLYDSVGDEKSSTLQRKHNLLNSRVNLEFVKSKQLEYYQQTGIFVPIVLMNGTTWNDVKFEYHPAQQSDAIPEGYVHVLPGVKTSIGKD